MTSPDIDSLPPLPQNFLAENQRLREENVQLRIALGKAEALLQRGEELREKLKLAWVMGATPEKLAKMLRSEK
jgi:hypothetical protein